MSGAQSKLDTTVEWGQNYSQCLQVHAFRDEYEESCCGTLLINSVLLINVISILET